MYQLGGVGRGCEEHHEFCVCMHSGQCREKLSEKLGPHQLSWCLCLWPALGEKEIQRVFFFSLFVLRSVSEIIPGSCVIECKIGTTGASNECLHLC